VEHVQKIETPWSTHKPKTLCTRIAMHARPATS